MKVRSFIRYLLILLLFSNPIITFAATEKENKGQKEQAAPVAINLIIEPDKIYDPDRLSFDSILIYEKNFNFDWNNYATITNNKKKFGEIETFMKTTKVEDYKKLNEAQRQSLGIIYYKMGTYYTHIARDQELAIRSMDLALMFIKKEDDKAWNYGQLAYAFEEKYAQAAKTEDKNKALVYTTEIITKIYPDQENKAVAFAYCVQGLLDNDEKNFGLAEKNFQAAIDIYEKLPDGKDDQYARAKSRMAQIILSMNDRDVEAIKMFRDLKQYWLTKINANQNPYAARNLILLGQAYLKTRNDKDAIQEFENALKIYRNIYGEKSELLAELYQFLSAAYKNIGNQQVSDLFAKKAKDLLVSH